MPLRITPAFLLVALVALTGSVPAGAAPKPAIVVLGVDAIGTPAEEAARLADVMRLSLAWHGAFSVIPWGKVDEALVAAGTTVAKCRSQKCAAELGASVGAAKVLIATYALHAGSRYLGVWLIDVETAVIEAAEAMKQFDPAKPDASVDRLLRRLTGQAPPKDMQDGALHSAALLKKTVGIVRLGRVEQDTDIRAAASGMSLFPGDKVITAEGRAEIVFPPGNQMRLGQDATLEIQPPADNTKPGVATVFGRLFTGAVLTIAKKIGPKEGFAVRSGSAVAAIKGTTFRMAEGLVAVVDEGDDAKHAVEVADLTGKVIAVVEEGMRGGIMADGTAVPAVPAPSEELAAIDAEFTVAKEAIVGKTTPEARLKNIQHEFGKVKFSKMAAVLDPASDKVLGEIAKVFAQFPDLKVRIEGHTDSRGNATANRTLSEGRAKAVMAWLVERGGVAAERLDAAGFGADQPSSTADTDEGRAENRRVEFVPVGAGTELPASTPSGRP